MIHICTIAAHDTSNGAGITRDCIVANDFGIWAHPVVTAITMQTFKNVYTIIPLSAASTSAQLSFTIQNFTIKAIKIGMLYQKETIEAVAGILRKFPVDHVVIDPVMFSSGNQPILLEEAYQTFMEQLLPLATLITPNKQELEFISGGQLKNIEEALIEARKISTNLNASILVKGGHFDGYVLTDYLVDKNNIAEVRHERRYYIYHHGSGCVLSTALTCTLVQGYEPQKALQMAADYTTKYFDGVNISMLPDEPV